MSFLINLLENKSLSEFGALNENITTLNSKITANIFESHVDITNLATNEAYTAPTDGYVYYTVQSGATLSFRIRDVNGSQGSGMYITKSGDSSTFTNCIFVRKGIKIVKASSAGNYAMAFVSIHLTS